MIKISKYSILKKFIQKFEEGFFDLLVIISRGGLGKTFIVDETLKTDVCKISVHATPLGLFQYGYIYKDKLMWFDDIEALFNEDKLVGLLKQFAQTQPVKEIKYLTSKDISLKDLNEVKIPKEYETTSKILMTCNSLKRIKDPSVLALLDRGIILFFNPSCKEIVKYIRDNFKNIDEEILISFERRDESFSLRDYVKKVQLKKAGFNLLKAGNNRLNFEN